MTRFHMQSGFTLGETLAALAVAAMGLALAVPGMQSLSDNNRRATSVNQLVSTLHLARSEAVMRNRHVTICASADAERCDAKAWENGWIAFVDTDADRKRNAGELLIDHVPGLTGLRLSSSEFDHAVTYRPDGRAEGAASHVNTGEFAFCEPDAEHAARTVIVRANGLPGLADKGRDGSLVACRSS